MFRKKLKVEINDNFNMILNYINSSLVEITYKELVQYCVDYDLYRELYVNFHIFEKLVQEKNKSLETSVQNVQEDILQTISLP